jgi:hypothetical protein
MPDANELRKTLSYIENHHTRADPYQEQRLLGVIAQTLVEILREMEGQQHRPARRHSVEDRRQPRAVTAGSARAAGAPPPQ